MTLIRGSSVRTVTGFIYVVIIALWAAVLIPMWLRRHDRISEVRSTKKFSTAMASLGSERHRAATSSSYEVHPAGFQQKARARTERSRLTNRSRAAQRRLVIFSLLAVTMIVTLALALISMISIIIPMVAAALVLAFVVAGAATASSRMNIAAQTAASTRTARSTKRDADVVELAAAAPAVIGDDWENWDPWAEDDSAWEAVPTTLPTYVNAPRASQVPRRIDRARPGEWTGEAMVDAAHALRRQVAFEDVDGKATTAEVPAVAFEESQRAVG